MCENCLHGYTGGHVKFHQADGDSLIHICLAIMQGISQKQPGQMKEFFTPLRTLYSEL